MHAATRLIGAMSGRGGIVYRTPSVLRRLWAGRNGRLLIIGALLVAVPLFGWAAILHVILTLPQPALSKAINFMWNHSGPPVATLAGCGSVVILFAVGRAIGDHIGTR